MRFTIVTPSYGQLDWLELCVASVRDQVATRAEAGDLSLSEEKVNEWEGTKAGKWEGGRCAEAEGIFIEHIVQDAGSPGIEEFAWRMGAEFYQDGEKVGRWESGKVGAERSETDLSEAKAADGSAKVGRWEGEKVGRWEGGSRSHVLAGRRQREAVAEGNAERYEGTKVETWKGGNLGSGDYSLTIYSEKDAGMYDAINRGLRKASGEICAYLNCDEQYLPGTLATVAEWFGSNKSSDVVFGDIVVVDPKGNYICDRTAMVPTKLHTLVSGNLAVYSAATFFRRDAVVDRGLLFSPDWKVVGDSVWILSLLDAGLKMGLLRRRVASFIYSGENLSLDVKGEQERAKLRATASPVARACAPAIVAFFRMRRLLAGGYSLPSQDYAIFTKKSGPRREVFKAKQPTHRWPRQ